MEQIGIRFNIIDQEKSKVILQENTYFFKLAYYRKNFYKYDDGYRIEFAHLSDLANTDMRFRYTLLPMTLDIEHALKCLLVKLITEDTNEDGYSIMDDFLSIDNSYNREDKNSQQPSTLEEIKNTNKERLFKHLKKRGTYPSELQKYVNDPPVWFCIEMMQFGQLTSFLEFYYDRSKNHLLKLPSKLMRLVKNIRNKCAHNQAILIQIHQNKQVKAPRELLSMTQQYQLPNNIYSVRPFIDILATFELHRLLCSPGIKNGRKSLILEMQQRYKRNFHYYKKSPDIQKFFRSMDKIIDNYNLVN